MTSKDNRRITVVPFRALTDPNLTDKAFRVLALICSYTDKNNMTFVSQQTLADICKVSRPAITNQISKLKVFGYIEIINKAYKGRNTNTIRVLFETPVHWNAGVDQQSKDNHFNNDADAQKHIAEMLKNVFNIRPTSYKQAASAGQSPTVQKMKEEIKKAQTIRQDWDPKPL
jgi:DNA-binding transcriptional MocR family regulator